MKTLAICLTLMTAAILSQPVSAVNNVVIVPLSSTVGDAVADDVLLGKTFSSHSGKGLTGTRFPAMLKKSGQTTPYNLNDDTFYNRGVETSPRWTYMQPNPGGGVVIKKTGYGYRDNNTGLIWHTDASQSAAGIIAAINYCENLQTVPNGYGGYFVTDWRLPNIVELLSLVDYGRAAPAFPADHHFTGVVLDAPYWSSTTNGNNTTSSWGINSLNGESKSSLGKSITQTAWILCVRD